MIFQEKEKENQNQEIVITLVEKDTPPEKVISTPVNTNLIKPIIKQTYGFIITRHVNSVKTNRYWNLNIQQLRKLYPSKLIVVIDDNSNPKFLKEDRKYQNTITIKSEYPGRAELLPYIYFAKYKWFDKAVIIHDGVFFHKRIPFEIFKAPVIPLWHFGLSHNRTHLKNNIRIASVLKQADIIKKYLSGSYNWIGCFGVQSFISHSFLTYIMNKYALPRLLKVVLTREDRCSLERIFAVIFHLETRVKTSILGSITKDRYFGYTFEQYMNSLKNKRIIKPVIKVFTGR